MWTVAELRIHPVKSAGALRVEEARVLPRGLENDRRWVVVDPQGKAVTQREEPRMALVQPRLDGGALVLDAPDAEAIAVRPDATRARVTANVWGGVVQGLAADPHVDRWWSERFDRPLAMVYMDDAARRMQPPSGTASAPFEVSFADELPLLVLSQASLAALSERSGMSLAVDRFRPNLVLAGGEPFEEDLWTRIGADDWELRLVKPAARCKVTTVDPETGGLHPKSEPLRTLAGFRRGHRRAAADMQKGVFFGMGALSLVADARLRVGETVRGLERF